MPLAAVLLAACGGAAAVPARPAQPAPAHPAPSPAQLLESARDLFASSRYAEAERDYRAAQVGDSARAASLGLAEVLLITGRYAQAAELARDLGGSEAERDLGASVRGEALRRLGRMDEARASLEPTARLATARRSRVALGALLLDLGLDAVAAPTLMSLIEDYNADRIAKSDALGLALVGRAAALLRSPRDANDAFNEAERAQAGHARTLLWRAELFLDRYDPGHAEEVVREVLTRAPNQPEALVWMAHVKLAQTYDFDSAEAFARKALAVDPRLAGAHFVLAGISLRDLEIAEADRRCDAGLATNPRDLDLLSLKAAIRFLDDDAAGFERAKERVLELSPRYTRLFQIVADYADWEHRYDEIVALMREALRIDPEDAKAEAQLGLGLIRGGDDASALVSLGTAFKRDPFNVRVFNTLHLYEDDIPKLYATRSGGNFRLRYPKRDQAVLERYVPALLDQAWAGYVQAYGFTPRTPVGVELYPSREHFAVRTSGLPGTGIQGVCFGRTLAAISPGPERFDLGMTLWHELAHVFHIQLSKSHVPRWFTEGLAEYETIVARPQWQRELDPMLHAALGNGRLPELGHMNRAFTRAEEMSDMATAYYASSQIVVMLAEKYGRSRFPALLAGWGAGKKTPELLREVFGKSPEELDAEFRAWAGARLTRYGTQFVPRERAPALDVAERAVKAAPKSAPAQVDLARARLRAGDLPAAEAALALASKLDPTSADAQWLDFRLAGEARDVPRARAAIARLQRGGHDGYAIQMAIATLAAAAHDPTAEEAALAAAHRFDPRESEPVAALAARARTRKDDAAELALLRELALLEEHDAGVHQRLLTLLVARGEYAEAVTVGERGMYVDLLSRSAHELFARALEGAKLPQRAAFELESALACDGSAPSTRDLHRRLATLYRATAQPKLAAEHARRAATP